jgi:UDP-N-acetylglucosamine acyltransferase
MADGNPVRPRGLNKVGLARRDVSAEAQLQLKRAYKLIFRSGMSLDNSIQELESQGSLLPEVQHLVDFVKNSPRGVCR